VVGANGQLVEVSSARNGEGPQLPAVGGSYSGAQQSTVMRRSTSCRGPVHAADVGGASLGNPTPPEYSSMGHTALASSGTTSPPAPSASSPVCSPALGAAAARDGAAGCAAASRAAVSLLTNRSYWPRSTVRSGR